MRMSAFIMGGIVGAAAALYFTRGNNRRWLSATNLNQVVDTAKNAIQQAAVDWLDQQAKVRKQQDSGADANQIEQMVNQVISSESNSQTNSNETSGSH